MIIGTYEGAAVKRRKFLLDRFFSAANSGWLFLLWGGCLDALLHARMTTQCGSSIILGELAYLEESLRWPT